MSLSGIFDPVAIKANLQLCLKGREQDTTNHKNTNQWLVNWEDWSDKAITVKVKKWKEAGCVASEEQLKFTAYVLCYTEILHRAVIGHNSKGNPLPISFPWFGPVFNPPTVEYREIQLRSPMTASDPFQAAAQKANLHKLSPLSCPEQFLVEPVIVISPVYFHHIGLDKCPFSTICTAKISKRGFTPTGPRTIYGVEYNLKAVGLEYECKDHGIFSTMSAERFWKDIPPWKCDDIPHFQGRSGSTRDLFDYIVEHRPRLSVGEMVETLRQRHLQYTRRLEKKWLTSALYEKSKYPDHTVKAFPTSLMDISTGALKIINKPPTEAFVRSLYEFFIDKQRREESNQYMRTLAGLAIGMDATIKIAKKANIYIRTETGGHKTVNMFDGGLLTGVNEDKELVICELLGTASSMEMAPPLQEFADRCDTHGIPFKTRGEICVDRCCSFRNALVTAVPDVMVTQDLAHLKNRIMETVSKKSLHRKLLSSEISSALIFQQSTTKGIPSLYHSPNDQAFHLNQIWKKYSLIPGVWTMESESVFKQQVKHVEAGCLQRRDPKRMSTTSYNENVHKQMNKLSIGHASSLTTIEALLTDFMLRYNIKININNMSQPPDSPSRLFRQQTNGSHHLFLLDHLLQQRERLTGISQPRFINIQSDHKFGLVARAPGSMLTSRYAKLDANLNTLPKQEDEGDDELKKIDEGDGTDGELVFTAVGSFFDDENFDATNPLDSASTNAELLLVGADSSVAPVLKRSYESVLEVPSKVRLLNDGTNEWVMDVIQPTSPVLSVYSEHMYPEHSSLYLPESSQTSSPFLTATDLPPTSPIMDSLDIVGGPSCSIKESELLDCYETTMVPEVASKVLSIVAPIVPDVSASTSAIQSSFSQSRTAQTYSKLTGVDVLTKLNSTMFTQGSAGYWRFSALRAQEQWSSLMPDKQWVLASEHHNNPSTFIDCKFYGNHGFPFDPIQRDAGTLKKFCREFEEIVRQWKTDMTHGKATSEWKKFQIAVDIPERTVTVSKVGQSIKVKTCQRCGKLKDGQGSMQSHQRDNCSDGFPIWNRVPFPVPIGLGRRLTDSNKKVMSVDPGICIRLFKELVDIGRQEESTLSVEMQNLLVFEALARRDRSISLAQAVLQGVEAYNFEPYRFKK